MTEVYTQQEAPLNRIEALDLERLRGLADWELYAADAWELRRLTYQGLPNALTQEEMMSVSRAVQTVTLYERSFFESPRGNSVRAVRYLGRAAYARGDTETYASATQVLRQDHGIRGKLASLALKWEAHKL